jgi:hypothetical protein
VGRLCAVVYRVLLLAYPGSFRRAHGTEAAAVFAAACEESFRQTGVRGIVRRLARAPFQVLWHGAQERLST